ncbi:MAG: bifunctional (p)ppGpp synthetase/guanosine-3',5'-bis(diphosphate) 3'-pyrophosphohydrolase [Ruminococcus sp.]|nr:bifunctional (p)ppGpp synthetase/guanosine-3',5'-bis(diphosphate) 3'-pyrophosphohydrolase [Ruminococcus sp.]
MSEIEYTHYENYEDYNDLVTLINESDNTFDLITIQKAYNLAAEAHGNQRRVSGIPYILHPTSVACILVKMGMDTDCVVAALLHDVVEDTDTELDAIKKEFGDTIAELIDGVTKLSKIKFSNREERQAENLRKMLIAMSNDIRVIIVKLADRLHNMYTIGVMNPQKQRDKALENMEVYAPIAHRLGMKEMKEKLEDISIRILDPVGYQEIENELLLKKDQRDKFIEKIKREITERIGDTVKHIYIAGRVKSINSIYRKTFMKGKTMDEIYDVFAVRVIVDSVLDCYNVLGVVHDIYQPIPNRFKDYISTPKKNMYQSLHTTVIGKDGVPFEVQIRTWEMHYTAEYGIAAHWKYKLGLSNKKSDKAIMQDRIASLRKMIENQVQSEDGTEIIKNIKNDLDQDEVFVFTPKGDLMNLPNGSTVIDLAYAIHTEVGNRMIGAKADRRIVPIDYKLHNGEIIEIITQREGTGPKRDWLKIVKTSEARTKIRQWFKREKRDENIIEGKAMLEAELKKAGIYLTDEDSREILTKIHSRHNCNTLDDFYAAIGYGGIQLWKVLPRIKEEYQKKYEQKVEEFIPPKEPAKHRRNASSGVEIEGLDNCLIKFSKCCSPLPGDNIIGFVTRGYGVSIHKRSCPNVPQNISESAEPERWVNAKWIDNIKENFLSVLEIEAVDRTGLLADLTIQLSQMHIFIHNLSSRSKKGGTAIVVVSIDTNGIDHLKGIMTHLGNINGIISVKRI